MDRSGNVNNVIPRRKQGISIRCSGSAPTAPTVNYTKPWRSMASQDRPRTPGFFTSLWL